MLDSFLQILQGEPAERAVWTADITYWMTGEKEAGRGDPAWDSEAGYLALYLASSASDFMTGQTLYLDGGLSL